MVKTRLAQDGVFWNKLSEYWRAYDDYRDMCNKQKLSHDQLPFCLCWPDHCRRAFFVSLAVLAVGVIVLGLSLWRMLPGGDSEHPVVVEAVVLVAAAFAWGCFFPDQYRSARRLYPNLLYFRSKNEKDLAKLEQAFGTICEVIAPYREQKRLEEEARQRRLAEEKQRYLKCFRPLWAHLQEVLDLDAGDFDPERVDDKFSVLVPGKRAGGSISVLAGGVAVAELYSAPDGLAPIPDEEDEGAGSSVLVVLKYGYNEEGLQGLIDKIAEIEAEQTRGRRQQELRAKAEQIFANNHP